MENTATTFRNTHPTLLWAEIVSLLALSFTKLQRLFVEVVVSNTNEIFQSAMTQ